MAYSTPHVYTSSARGVRVHKATCKRVGDGAIPMADITAKEILVAAPATCCRPNSGKVESLLAGLQYRLSLLDDVAKEDNLLSLFCPRCGQPTINTQRPSANALSRKDSKTYVCPPCGTDEAMLNLAGGRDADVWPGYPGQITEPEAESNGLELYEVTVFFSDAGVSKHYWKAFGVEGGTLVADGVGVQVDFDNKALSVTFTSVSEELLSEAATALMNIWTEGFAAFKTWRRTDENYKALPSQVTHWVTSERYAWEQKWLREFTISRARLLPLGGLI